MHLDARERAMHKIKIGLLVCLKGLITGGSSVGDVSTAGVPAMIPMTKLWGDGAKHVGGVA